MMRIGELASLTGVAASTLRFYERNGLLPTARRGVNGYRDYPLETTEQIGQIRLAQNLGFNLEQIRKALGNGEGGKSHELIEQGLRTRLEEIDLLQLRLQEQRQGVVDMLAGLHENWAAGRCLKLAEVLSGEAVLSATLKSN